MRGTPIIAVAVGLGCATWLAACAGSRPVAKATAMAPDEGRTPEPACGAAPVPAAAPVLAPAPVEKPAPTPGAPVAVEFFVMSKCPFGAQVENLIAPLLARMGKRVAFSLEYIGTEKDGRLSAMHGESEVQGDKIQLCAAKLFPKRYLDLILCMNENQRAIPDRWRACANRADIAAEPIAACADGEDGTVMLRGSYMRSRERRALGSPTMFISGKQYSGPRSEQGLARAICLAMSTDLPAICAELPKPVAVPATILTDSRCRECKSDRFKAVCENLFPGAEIRVLDYTSREGKTLYASLGPERVLLPALLFGRQVERAENYARLSRMLVPRGEFLLLRAGSMFDPTREICDNGQDDTGNGKIDCADPDCANVMVCRPEKPGQLEVFIMSQCPFAVRGLNAMGEILDVIGSDILFEIHFVATAEGGEFRSLHGPAEVAENIRELCVIKYYPKNHKYMDYIWCRNKDIRSAEWQVCTGINGIDPVLVKTCAEGDEGRRLLREDVPLAEGLQIRGSPTWIVNGRYKFNGIDAATIRKNFCAHNPELGPCRE
ncbi:MAG TPA: hypothetical protein VM425_06130 [Myxococcota bacterium]|nr:hypothetical protein [Myxococcota bacterium]